MAELSTFTRLRSRRLPRLSAATVTIVFLGGIGGGLARYGITETWSTPTAGFPWPIFFVNTVGAFALCLLIALIADVLTPRGWLRPVLGTGFLGAFTTFSSVMTAVDQLLAHGHPFTASLYLGGSIIAALGAGSFGLVLGRAVAARRRRTLQDQP